MVSTVNNNTNTTTTNGQTSGAKSLTDTYQTFLSLLTAQIRNQDPLSPMDTTDWTNQLVQYNAVEQQLKGNTYLETLVNQSKLAGLNTGVDYIGKVVTGSTDTVALNDGQAQWNFDLPKDALSVQVNVKDSQGRVVFTEDLGNQRTGAHSFTWDGKVNSGSKLTSGDYTLSVTALDKDKASIDTAISVSGKVTAVVNEDGSTVLKLGQTNMPLSKVNKVEASS